jgi:hypothetical protein
MSELNAKVSPAIRQAVTKKKKKAKKRLFVKDGDKKTKLGEDKVIIKTLPKKLPPRLDTRNKKKDTQSKTGPSIPVPYKEISMCSAEEQVTMTLNSDDWLFTQATGIVSCNVEGKFKVTKNTAPFINSNGIGFPSEVLAKYYKSFIGAHNYRNHEQDPKKSYGVVLDAVLRKVPVKSVITGKKTDETNYYVDLLIATNRKVHKEWCKAIESGVVKFLSMGCMAHTLQCSQCGKKSHNSLENCYHMNMETGLFFIDSSGDKRITASLVVDEKTDDDDPLNFIEISYLTVNPAFPSAIMGYVLNPGPNKTVTVSVPAKYAKREAFQVWSKYIQFGKETLNASAQGKLLQRNVIKKLESAGFLRDVGISYSESQKRFVLRFSDKLTEDDRDQIIDLVLDKAFRVNVESHSVSSDNPNDYIINLKV